MVADGDAVRAETEGGVTPNERILGECSRLAEFLCEKNRKYGNSALDPVRVFSRADRVEALAVRIDDKLSRIQRGAGVSGADEDTILDLIGYLILLRIARQIEAEFAEFDEIPE